MFLILSARENQLNYIPVLGHLIGYAWLWNMKLLFRSAIHWPSTWDSPKRYCIHKYIVESRGEKACFQSSLPQIGWHREGEMCLKKERWVLFLHLGELETSLWCMSLKPLTVFFFSFWMGRNCCFFSLWIHFTRVEKFLMKKTHLHTILHAYVSLKYLKCDRETPMCNTTHVLFTHLKCCKQMTTCGCFSLPYSISLCTYYMFSLIGLSIRCMRKHICWVTLVQLILEVPWKFLDAYQ